MSRVAPGKHRAKPASAILSGLAHQADLFEDQREGAPQSGSLPRTQASDTDGAHGTDSTPLSSPRRPVQSSGVSAAPTREAAPEPPPPVETAPTAGSLYHALPAMTYSVSDTHGPRARNGRKLNQSSRHTLQATAPDSQQPRYTADALIDLLAVLRAADERRRARKSGAIDGTSLSPQSDARKGTPADPGPTCRPGMEDIAGNRKETPANE